MDHQRAGRGQTSGEDAPLGVEAGDLTQPMPPITLAEEPPVKHEDPAGNKDGNEEADGAELDADGRPLDAQTAEFSRLMRERKARKKKRLIRRIVVAVVVAALVVGFMVWRSVRPDASDGMMVTPTSQVEQGTFEEKVSASGSIEPISSTVVTPQISGTIGEVRVQEGATVNAGDVLFTINNDQLDQDVDKAALALRVAQTGLRSAQTQVNQLNEQIAAGEQDEEQYDAAVAAADQLPAAQNAVESAQLDVQQAQAAYDQAVAETNKRTVTAPVAGTILTMNAVAGASVGGGSTDGSASGSGSQLCQIADLSRMKVNVSVNENDIIKLAKDQTAKVTFSAIPDLELDAAVDTIASTTSASADASMGGSSGNGYAVRLIIPSPDPRLKPGMTASVKIITQQIKDTLLVPASALVDDGDGGQSVMVETDPETHDFKTVKVEVKAKNGAKAAVDGKLKAGDTVILGGGSDTPTDASDDMNVVTMGAEASSDIERMR